MSSPLHPCDGSLTTSSSSTAAPINSAENPAEEDIDALIENYAREFERMERQDDLDAPKGATWERTAEQLSKSSPICGEVDMQYDPEGKNRAARVEPEDRYRLLAFIEARKAQYSSQGGSGGSKVSKKRSRKND